MTAHLTRGHFGLLKRFVSQIRMSPLRSFVCAAFACISVGCQLGSVPPSLREAGFLTDACQYLPATHHWASPEYSVLFAEAEDAPHGLSILFWDPSGRLHHETLPLTMTPLALAGLEQDSCRLLIGGQGPEGKASLMDVRFTFHEDGSMDATTTPYADVAELDLVSALHWVRTDREEYAYIVDGMSGRMGVAEPGGSFHAVVSQAHRESLLGVKCFAEVRKDGSATYLVLSQEHLCGGYRIPDHAFREWVRPPGESLFEPR